MRAMRKNKRRLILLATAVLLLVVGGVQAVALIIGWSDAREQLESTAKGVAVSIAHTLSLDPEAYRELSLTKDPESAYYKKMHFHLKSIKEETGNIKFITTENRISDTATEYILDAEPIGSDHYAPPGERGFNHRYKDPVFSTGDPTAYSSKEGTANQWGKLIGGYAPIVAENGEILGIAGVDIDSKYIWRQFIRTLYTLIVANLIIFALFIASLLGFSGAILDRMFMDKLTGAYAKRHFDALLADGIQRCIKYKQGLALMMLDLDHFKNVNDTYGHPFGDKVLAAVSEVIRGSIRSDDAFVRYGGEEFALIVASAGAENVMEIAERLRAAVEGRPIFNEDRGVTAHITVSIGVARFVNLSQTPEELVENADRALYQAKVTRNAVKLHA